MPVGAVEQVDAGDEQRWIEAALAADVDAPRLRVWRYRAAALVLGRGQRELLAAQPRELATELRASGGGAVLVGPWMIGASVVLPAAHRLAAAGIVESFRGIGEACAHWLRALGVSQARAERGGPTLGHWACFAGRGPWEVMVGDRKIVGLAQARRRHAVLLAVGALVADTPWQRLTDALGRPAADAAAIERATVSAESVLGRPVDAGAWARELLTTLDVAVGDAPGAPPQAEGRGRVGRQGVAG